MKTVPRCRPLGGVGRLSFSGTPSQTSWPCAHPKFNWLRPLLFSADKLFDICYPITRSIKSPPPSCGSALESVKEGVNRLLGISTFWALDPEIRVRTLLSDLAGDFSAAQKSCIHFCFIC